MDYHPDFFDALSKAAKTYPSINNALTIFITEKTKSPPGSLPRGMRDHKLSREWDGYNECHLKAGDALLIYTFKNSVVKLITVFTHDELDKKPSGKIKSWTTQGYGPV